MNKRQENRLTMYEGLLTLLQANSAKGGSITGYSDALTELSTLVDGLKGKSEEANGATVGKTASKSDAAFALISAMLPVCSALYIFGRRQSSEEIRERVNVTEAALHAMRDTELASFGKTIADLAATYAGDLAPFGIGADAVADLKAKAVSYSAAIGAKESSIADRKGARGSMGDLFIKVDELLDEEFDRYMQLLRPTETEFYNKYFAARLVKDTGVRHRTPAPTAPAGPATKA